MFKKNPAEKQFNLMEPYYHFQKYVLDVMHNSWAEYIFHSIFKKIDEERFAVRYSEKYSRPNAPVNLTVGLLMLKELNSWTDEETIAALYFDYRVQYALGIGDFDKERICINTLGNFRSWLYQHFEEHGRDLLEKEVSRLTDFLITLSGMDTKLARQDSMMISANCKRMGRLELIYTINANMVFLLRDEAPEIIPESCAQYLQNKDKADQIYRLKKEEVPERTIQLLKESVELSNCVPNEFKESQSFKNLARLIEEQTDGSRSPKDDQDPSGGIMQNPWEQDATFRRKGNKSSVGYTLNIVEARDNEKAMSMIVHTERCPNIISDIELGLNTLDADLKGVETLVSDGAFYSQEVAEKALEKGIEVSFSALNGRGAPEGKLGADQFAIDPDTGLIMACPGGFAPALASRDREKRPCHAKFNKEDCASCPLKESCIVKEQKRFNAVTITDKKLIADRYRSLLGTAMHQVLADFRARAERVPSVLRRVYRVAIVI